MVAALTAGLWIVAGVTLLWTSHRSRRHWGEPGAKPFTALAATVGCAAFALGAVPFEPHAHLVALPLLYNVLPVLWAVFVFEFTGQYEIGGTRRRFLLAAPAVYQTFVYVGFTLAASRLTGAPVTAVESAAWYAVVQAATGPAASALHVFYATSFVSLFYLIGVMIAATAVLVSQLVRYDHLGQRVAALLPVSVVGPWLVVVTATTASMNATFATDPLRTVGAVVFLAAAGGLALVLDRSDLFAAAPAAGTVGPERVIQDLSEPIVVADHDERVIRINPAARRVFGTDGEYVGNAVADLLGHDVGSLRTADSLDIDGVDGHHHYQANVSEMTDQNGRVRGHAVVLRDVTGREVRQQRLEVLNRVLRHNLRNDLTAIRGRAELLGTDDVDESVVRDVVVETADDLLALSDRAREVEQMLSIPIVEGQTCDLATVVSTIVDDVADDHDAAVTVSVPGDVTVGVDARILQPIVHNLVVNAIRHHDRDDPTIEVSAAVGEGSLPVTLLVADDGPGLPEQERLAVERGHENPLEHGSGLGLWVIKWGVTRIGGHLSISDNDPRGTVVEISLPGPGSELGADEPTATDATVPESALGAADVDSFVPTDRRSVGDGSGDG